MKKFITLLFFCIYIFNLNADNWKNHWVSAVNHCSKKQYDLAKREFDSSIELLEDQNQDEPHVYVDRARLNLILDDYEKSLLDVNKALSSNNLTKSDRIRGLITRIYACGNLEMHDQVEKDYNTFKSISTDFPKVEFSKEMIIIRNVPNSNCYKNITKSFLLASEICEKEEDIKFLDSGIMIAKRKTCNCGCVKKQGKEKNERQQKIDQCTYWCDKCALAGTAWCFKSFKTWKCQTGCVFAVDLLKDACHWCCSEGNFYLKCIKPFEDILEYMKQPCDPEWD